MNEPKSSTKKLKQFHKLSMWGENIPKVAVEGEKVSIKFFTKNIVDTIFSGGELALKYFPADIGITFFHEQTVTISKIINPNSEITGLLKDMVPLSSGYTFFIIEKFHAIDDKEIIVCESDEKECYPKKSRVQIFHKVRAQTHEEISQKKQFG